MLVIERIIEERLKETIERLVKEKKKEKVKK